MERYVVTKDEMVENVSWPEKNFSMSMYQEKQVVACSTIFLWQSMLGDR